MSNPGIYKTKLAGSVIPPYVLVAHGAQDGAVALATVATDALCGVTQELGADAVGDPVDVCKGGLPEIRLGGDVVRGDPLTSDTEGRAIKATVSGSRIIGFAEVSGAEDDIVPFLFAPGVLP
ncbi:DUF2190 family protein [Desulfocurvus vexinensis]|uniref:DUF2190 family protein n=1 Tax=Desulfocurvus vexinensis TaxID=399548 RepID=UPI000491D3E5|nr:DUF2190 family protein [Desulfocurvus vexinensis]